eukprot:COSAG01_NODE_79601_length_129_cov_57.033333_1_plen_26_part_01
MPAEVQQWIHGVWKELMSGGHSDSGD